MIVLQKQIFFTKSYGISVYKYVIQQSIVI